MSWFTKIVVAPCHSRLSQGGAGRRISRAGRRGRRAFTLIELLGWLIPIGLMIGLLMPMVYEARCSALRTDCRDNSNQVGLTAPAHPATYQSAARASE